MHDINSSNIYMINTTSHPILTSPPPPTSPTTSSRVSHLQEAHTKFVERVNNFKQITKSLDEKSESMKKEIREMKTTIDESEQSTGVVSV